jgi:hypothetical protein
MVISNTGAMATFGLPDRTGIVPANTAEAVCLRPQSRFVCCSVIEIELNLIHLSNQVPRMYPIHVQKHDKRRNGQQQ